MSGRAHLGLFVLFFATLATRAQADGTNIRASHQDLGEYTLQCEGAKDLLFTENESNNEKLWGQPNSSPYVKDAFHRYVISGESGACPKRTIWA